MMQDHAGMLWLGTQHGLYRFDGSTSTLFQADPEDASSLSADWITSLLVDDEGILWIGTRYGGLNRYNPQTGLFQRVPFPAPYKDTVVEISVVYQDQLQRVWLGTYGAGLFYWDEAKNELQSVSMPAEVDGVSTTFINDLKIDSHGHLWLAIGDAPLRSKSQARGGLVLWQPEQGSGRGWHPDNSALTYDSLTRLYLDQQQQLWFTTYYSGLWQLDIAQHDLQQVAGPAAWQGQGQLTDLLMTPAGDLWVSSYDAGLWHRPADSMQWQHFPHNSEVSYGVPSPAITNLMLDQQQSLWLISQSGFSRLSQYAQQVRTLPPGSPHNHLLPASDVFGIQVVSQSEVWLANRAGGVARFNPKTGQLQHFPLPDGERAPTLARKILKESQQIWVGTDRGLYQLDPSENRWQKFPLGLDPNEEPNIATIIKDDAGKLWIGTRGQGVVVLDQQRQFWAHFHPAATETSIPIAIINDLMQDDDGYIWIGSPDQGLVRLNPETNHYEYWFQQEGNPSGLLYNGIQLLYQQNGHVWIRAGNLNHRWLGPGSEPAFRAYTSDEVFDDELIEADEFRLLYRLHWLESQQSLVKLGPPHGLQDNTWIGALDVKDRTLFRGGPQGLDYYPIDRLPEDQRIPGVQLTRLSLFNQEVVPGESDTLPVALPYLERLQLNYQQDMFSLHFIAPNFIQPHLLQYRYRLQGFDRDWLLAASDERVATYTRLPPGQYEFQVAVRVANGEWQTAETLAIQVLPPWWMTWWFRSFMMALLLFSIWGWLHYKMRSERKMRQQLQRQVAERTQALKEKHDALQASNQDLMLLQQMGREITASLDLELVLSRCHQMLSELIDAHVMVIGLQRPSKREIEFVFWLEDNQKLPGFSVSTEDNGALASICFQRKQEIYVNQRSDFLQYLSSMPEPLRGEPMQSVLYIPLLVDKQAVGVFSVQSPKPAAYTESQLQLLRTLANTIAIAVVNADTFTRLQQTQQQLVTQEKMASLGGLVAGVAHEINTPLGICVTATSHLQAELEQVQQAVANKVLRQSQFDRFLQHLAEGLKILDVNTERAASLVQSFKQVSVDQSSDSLRDIDVADYLQDILLSLQPQIRKQHCQFALECADSIHWTTDAGALAQIVTNLVMNSLKHAFAETVEPRISLKVEVVGKELHLHYQDNGCGMAERELKRLFEPFYTTQRGLGGTGLGAHIVYNLITVRFNGQLKVSSELGQGLNYHIILPMDAC
ncbi:MAG: GAF domain-containing protein [Alkalimonas sp.]|nr:GAF domain-containing protein [Alkalimonas sp.]